MRDSKGQERKPFGPRKMIRFAPKKCKFCMDKVPYIDYKDIALLRRFLTPSGKILGSRVTGNCSRHQSYLTRAIKRARYLALLPFIVI